MQIILVSRHLKTARTLTIMPRHWLIAALLLLSTVVATAMLIVRIAAPEALGGALGGQAAAGSSQYLANNLQMMAARLGELQAKLVHLDSLGEHLSGLAGVRREAPPQPAVKPAGQGGAFVPAPMSVAELQREIDRLAAEVELRSDDLAVLESSFLEKRVRDRLMPTTLPVREAALGSPYGYRNDPVVGLRAMHEGIDFNAEIGTPVVAAADGVVLSAGWQGDFGNMVEIDHGDGLSTRYAHLSRMDVKPGALIKRGTRIGAIGTTGRSTGPHLHFEVRMLGVAQNPAQFLKVNQSFAALPRR